MTVLRVGTRGSDLALAQTRWVCRGLREAHRSLRIEEVVIKTHGDIAPDQPLDADWPVGGFVGAIEKALGEDLVDFAVHSFKDLPIVATAGLVVAAVPPRQAVHDVLLTRAPVDLDRLPAGFRLGTGSPRRAAQFRRLAEVRIVPVRGNVPTRIAKLERENLDGVVLAAAGLRRLGLSHPHTVDLPTDRFAPSPGQGALAIQARRGSHAVGVLEVLDHAPARRAVTAERSFLRAVGAGCRTPLGALARPETDTVSLYGQLFSDDGTRLVQGQESGSDPERVGERLARRLISRLKEIS